MTNEEKLSKALQNFRNKYPNITSGDLQTFIIGWNECLSSLSSQSCDHTNNKCKEDCEFQLNKNQKNMPLLKDEHMVFLSDEIYTPIHYKGMIVEQPFYEDRGNHSVAKLEEICEQFKEYCHQQTIIKQNCMKHIVELKFGIEFPK